MCSGRGREKAGVAARSGEGREESRQAEAGGSPWFCGWTRSSAHGGRCGAPWTPHTGTPPGPRCRSCRRSRCSPARGVTQGEKDDRSGWGAVRRGEEHRSRPDADLCPDLDELLRHMPGFPENTSGLEVESPLPSPIYTSGEFPDWPPHLVAGPGPWGRSHCCSSPRPGPSPDPAGHFPKAGASLEPAGCHLLYQMGQP